MKHDFQLRHLLGQTAIGTVILSILVAAGCDKLKSAGKQQAPPKTFADAQAAANESLATFRQLVNAQNYKELGFESAEEAANAKLGEPIHVLVVSLSQLRQYEPGSDPNRLLTDFNQIHYPVVVGDQVRSAIMVDQANGKWKTGTLGAANLAKLIAAARKATQTANPSEAAVVEVPSLGLYFLGHHTEDGKLTLTPLTDNAGFGFRAGGTMPAEQVFATLVPAAKSLNTDAPM
jgi:hypothetical protein